MNWVDGCLQALLPVRCRLCHQPLSADPICADCRADLPWQAQGCTVCGRELPPGCSPGPCARCAGARPAPARVFAPLAYRYPVDRLVTGAKYRRRLQDARLLGVLLAESLAGALQAGAVVPVDLLVPVPLHPHRLGARGYNQALEIARPIARVLGVPVAPDACQRVRDTPEQAGLPAAARRRNLRAAFAAEALLRGARVAVVDDVITTGSTVAAMAEALRRAGAIEVQGWVAARTPLDAGIPPR